MRTATVTLFVLWHLVQSAPVAAQVDSLLLYPEGVPGAIPSNVAETTRVNPQDGVAVTTNVQTPVLYVHQPDQPNGTAVIICPGGGYYVLAMEHEGHAVARWFNERGVTAFVLKSRLPNEALMTRKAIRPLQDAQQAIRMVRRDAEQWSVRPDRIGVMGFSAGGHLAATVGTRFEEPVTPRGDASVSLRPDFMVLVYPALRPTDSATLDATFENEALLGADPPDSLRAAFTAVQHVDAAAPPTFLVHASDDDVVDPGGSVDFYLALRRHRVPAELHLYATGGHGFSLAFKERGRVVSWDHELEGWLRERGLLARGR
jgi:acetyl esterase/lipase